MPKIVTLYIGNLAYDITDADLQADLQQFGDIKSASVIRFADSKKSKGFAFIEVAEPDAPAFLALNGAEYAGRRLIVAPKREKPVIQRSKEPV